MSTYFHTSETIVNLTVAFYMLSMSIFPLWWYVLDSHSGVLKYIF